MLVSMLVSMLTTWWAVALEISWKSAVVLTAACAASLLLLRASSALRHAVWVLALGGLLLLPVLQVLLPAWRPAALRRAQVELSGVRVGATESEGAAPQQHTVPRS